MVIFRGNTCGSQSSGWETLRDCLKCFKMKLKPKIQNCAGLGKIVKWTIPILFYESQPAISNSNLICKFAVFIIFCLFLVGPTNVGHLFDHLPWSIFQSVVTRNQGKALLTTLYRKSLLTSRYR